MAQPIYKPNASLDSSPIQHVGGAFDKVVETTSKIAAEQQEKREALFQNKQKQGLARATEKLAGISDVKMAEALAKDPAAFMNSIGAAELSDTTQAQIANKLAGVVDQARERTKNEDEFKTFEQKDLVNKFVLDARAITDPGKARQFVDDLSTNESFLSMTATNQAAVLDDVDGLEGKTRDEIVKRIQHENTVFDNQAETLADRYLEQGGSYKEALKKASNIENAKLRRRTLNRLFKMDDENNTLLSSEETELKGIKTEIAAKYDNGEYDANGKKIAAGLSDYEFELKKLDTDFSNYNAATNYNFADLDGAGVSGTTAIDNITSEIYSELPTNLQEETTTAHVKNAVTADVNALNDAFRKAANAGGRTDLKILLEKDGSKIDTATIDAAVEMFDKYGGFPAAVIKEAATASISQSEDRLGWKKDGLVVNNFKAAAVRKLLEFAKVKKEYDSYLLKRKNKTSEIKELERKKEAALDQREIDYRSNRESRRNLGN